MTYLQRETPNASQWNIGCVGSPTQNFRVGNVHFIFCVLISFAFSSQRKPSFQWNMGFTLWFVVKESLHAFNRCFAIVGLICVIYCPIFN